MEKEKKAQHHNHHQKEGENKAAFNCKKCGKKFNEIPSLKEHEETHLSGEQQELEKIKNEILKEINPQNSKKELSWGSALVTGFLILLTFVSVGQAIQSFNILKKIENGAIKPANAQSSTPLPSSLQDLPNMVGGC